MRVMGIDPGLRNTGWGVIDAEGNRLSHVANGVLRPDASCDTAERLLQLHEGLVTVLRRYRPDSAAVETSLSNRNAASTLKLGMARGTALVAAALQAIEVREYLPMIVKKAVVGTGHADKRQVAMMVARLLPGCDIAAADAADALAVAICHAHNSATDRRWSEGGASAPAGRTAEGRRQ